MNTCQGKVTSYSLALAQTYNGGMSRVKEPIMLSTFSAADITDARNAVAQCSAAQWALGEVPMEVDWRGHSLAEFAQARALSC